MTTLPKLLGLVGSDWVDLALLVVLGALACIDIGLISIIRWLVRR